MKKGIESLREAVIKNCNEGEGCFNPNGCNHEFYRNEPETNPELIKLGMTTCCRHVSKCSSKYCDKYKWILERAEYYANLAGTTSEKVLEAWEEKRGYCFMNYYQECNQPKAGEKTKVIPVAEWKKMLDERFGSPKEWKFVCPICGHVQSVQDFLDINVDANNVYHKCIGRFKADEGCDYTINGLIKICKTAIIADDLNIVPVFEMAEK